MDTSLVLMPLRLLTAWRTIVPAIQWPLRSHSSSLVPDDRYHCTAWPTLHGFASGKSFFLLSSSLNVPAKESAVCSSLATRVFVEANGSWNRSERRTHGSTASQDRLASAIGVYQTVAVVTEITPGVTLRVGTSCGPLTTLRRQVRTRRAGLAVFRRHSRMQARGE